MGMSPNDVTRVFLRNNNLLTLQINLFRAVEVRTGIPGEIMLDKIDLTFQTVFIMTAKLNNRQITKFISLLKTPQAFQ